MRKSLAALGAVAALLPVAGAVADTSGHNARGRLSPPVVRESFTPLPCGGTPTNRTTVQREGCAEHEILRTDARINRLARSIFTHLQDTPARRRFIGAQHAWVAYRQADCRSQSDLFEGGSEAPVIAAQCAAARNQERVAQLRAFLSGLGG